MGGCQLLLPECRTVFRPEKEAHRPDAEELDKKLAERMRRIRRRRKVSQQKLSDMSGVSYGSIKRFETTGQISLLSLTKLAMALELADELRDLFTQVPYRNIQEVINESKGKS